MHLVDCIVTHYHLQLVCCLLTTDAPTAKSMVTHAVTHNISYYSIHFCVPVVWYTEIA